MHGEELPAGNGIFHSTAVSGPNNTGGSLGSATPPPPGPWNCGQLASAAETVDTASKAIRPGRRRGFMEAN